MKNVLFLLLLFVLSAVGLQAQPLGKSDYNKLIDVAEKSMAQENWYNALLSLEEAYDDKKDKELLPLLAKVKLMIRDYNGAERNFASALRSDKKGDLDTLRYDYGRALKMNGKYEEAIAEFQTFLDTEPDEVKRLLTQNEITGCEMAMAFKDDRKDEYKPKRLGKIINKKDTEYAPKYSREGNIYFATFATEEVIIPGEDTAYAKIYYSQMDEEKEKYGEPKELSIKVNRPGYTSSGASFTPDGNRMYFTRARLVNNMIAESKIYMAEGGDGNWGASNECVGVNGEWISKHPAPGELFGREVLFFVADIDGGYGGDDIYYSTYRGDGVYTDPVNLGPSINSPGNEITPHYIDGTLYFSSDGHPGYGGQDIFFTVWDGSKWSAPENIGGRYNSAQDDQYFSLDNEGINGLFTSNRTGTGMRSVEARTCCDDVYQFELERIEASLLVGTFDKKTDGELLGAKVVLSNLVLNRSQSQSKGDANAYSWPLDLETSYRIVGTKEGYYPDTAQVSTVDLQETKEFVVELLLEPIPPPEPIEVIDTITVYDTVTIENAVVLENILYDFNDDKILPKAEPDLNILLDLLNQYADLVIELSSHTDYRGGNDYNQRLSQRRANSARRWLVNKGVEGKRIVAKGYGENLPKKMSKRVADKFDFLNEGDTLTQAYIDSLETEEQQEEAHQINRRTEFKILDGPTSIAVPKQEIRRRMVIPEGPNRETQPKLEKGSNSQIKIHEKSSLYGVDDLSNVPILVFKEREIDFGEVKKGEKREHVFEFTNQGDVAAVIAVISACDCTTTDYDKKEIKPGESGKITVVFDSTDKDDDEPVVVDIFLENKTKDDYPVVEKVEYTFKLK